MKYDFDREIDRRGSGSLKWDHYAENVVPAWVADMDFEVPYPVVDALHQRVDHAVFGYTLAPHELTQTIVERLKRLYNADICPEWIVWLPGLVPGFNLVARAFGGTGAEVLTNTPVYPPFLSCGENNGHHTVAVDLVEGNRGWQIDFDALERAVTPQTYMFLLCSPHNPTGRIWNRTELERLVEFCCVHDLIICSDEIHCDLLLDVNKAHIPTFTVSEEACARTVTLMAPSKTYNIAGLNCSYAVIASDSLRCRFRKAMNGLIPFVNALGYGAALAAYRDGEEWLEQVLDYLRENHRLVLKSVEEMSGVTMLPVEATYLAWLDVRELGLVDPYDYFLSRGVALSDGKLFGMSGYLRLNFACRRALLCQMLECLKDGIAEIGHE